MFMQFRGGRCLLFHVVQGISVFYLRLSVYPSLLKKCHTTQQTANVCVRFRGAEPSYRSINTYIFYHNSPPSMDSKKYTYINSKSTLTSTQKVP